VKYPGINYASPNTFTLRQRLTLAVLVPLLHLCIRLLVWTCRFEIRGREHFEERLAAGERSMLALWHEAFIGPLYYFRNSNFHTITSYSFDGELAARVVASFGCEAVRGSTSRGGSEGLSALVAAVRRVPSIGITMDGPRGPRRVAKPGLAILSGRTQTSVVPMASTADRAWRLNSWDRFLIPKPFSRIIIAFGPVIAPPVDDSPEEVERKRCEIETKLNALHAEIEAR
jgi:lysophospholipid acyltransferase (LPLAT)-like uncharacterized protein